MMNDCIICLSTSIPLWCQYMILLSLRYMLNIMRMDADFLLILFLVFPKQLKTIVSDIRNDGVFNADTLKHQHQRVVAIGE